MPIPLPPHIIALIQTLRKEIDDHAYHNFEPQKRLILYTAFGPRTDPFINAFRSWWAIYTAERVLPLFVAALPDEVSPPCSLKIARRVALGLNRRDATAVNRYREMNYHWSGQVWGHEGDLPVNAYYAGTAACQALDEVCRLEEYRFMPHVDLTGTTHGITDLMMAGQAVADTASCAAMAFAVDEDEDCDFDKLHQFWTWWLTEALEQAWNTANEQR